MIQECERVNVASDVLAITQDECATFYLVVAFLLSFLHLIRR